MTTSSQDWGSAFTAEIGRFIAAFAESNVEDLRRAAEGVAITLAQGIANTIEAARPRQSEIPAFLGALAAIEPEKRDPQTALLDALRAHAPQPMKAAVASLVGPPQLTDTWMSRDGHRVLLPAIMVESLVIEPVPQEFNSLVSNSAAFRRVTLKLKIAPRTRVLRLKLRTFDASGSVLSEQFLHLPAGSKETSTYIGSRTEVSKAVVAPADRLGDAPWSLLPSEEFPAAGADTPAEQADAEPSAPVSAAVHQARSLLAFALAAATLRETSESYDTASVVLDHYIHVTA